MKFVRVLLVTFFHIFLRRKLETLDANEGCFGSSEWRNCHVIPSISTPPDGRKGGWWKKPSVWSADWSERKPKNWGIKNISALKHVSNHYLEKQKIEQEGGGGPGFAPPISFRMPWPENWIPFAGVLSYVSFSIVIAWLAGMQRSICIVKGYPFRIKLWKVIIYCRRNV